MRHTFRLALLALSLLVLPATSMAQGITSLSMLKNNTPYLIHNVNGYGFCIYNPLVSDEYATLGGGSETHPNGNANPLFQQSIDPTDKNNQWYIIPTGKDTYYLYNLGRKKYLTNKTIETLFFGSWEYQQITYGEYFFTDDMVPFTISGKDGRFNFRLTEVNDETYDNLGNGSTKYMCAATHKVNAIAFWTADDLGSIWAIEEANLKEFVYISSITLNETTLTMVPDETFTLLADVQPTNATYRDEVTWTSTNPLVASVENGVVTAHRAGVCTIRIEAHDGSKLTAECNVTVKRTDVPVNPTDTLGTLRYFTFHDGQMVVIPEKYILDRTQEDGVVNLTLVGDTVWSFQRVNLASEDTNFYGTTPEFESFKFNNKFNDQLFTDVDGVIDSEAHRIDLSVPCIGKRLTASFKVPDDATVWVNGVRQHSKVTRQRYDKPLIYTVAYPKNWIYRVNKVSDDIWSTPDETDNEEEWLHTPIALTMEQLSTNAPSNYPDTQDLAFVIDGEPSGNYYHSTWGNGEHEKLPWKEGDYYGDGRSEWPYIQIEMAEPVQNFQFEYVTGANNRRWMSFVVQGSNDGETWEDIQAFDEERDALPTGTAEAWTSPIIASGTTYNFLRFQATSCYYKNYITLTELGLWNITPNPDYGKDDDFVPELIAKAEYEQAFVPFGTDYVVDVEYLTDHSTDQYSVPRIDINTFDGTMISSKDYYWDASFTLSGNGIYEDIYVESMQIKGRGNSSWSNSTSSKNPYRLKFPEKIKPFGLAKGKNWVLLANKQTGSMTTNAVAMKLADMVETAACNHIIPVELYINGQYRGSYNFTEKIGFANNSVDLDDESYAVMLELDTYYDEVYKFRDQNYSLHVNVKQPELDDPLSGTQLNFNGIKNAFNNLTYDMKLGGWDFYAEQDIDINSVVRAMLVTDLTRNCEYKHPKSWYIYNENLMTGSPWVLGPVWDFDWAYGYDGTNKYFIYSAEMDLLSPSSADNLGAPFFHQLLRGSEVVQKAYYKEWTRFLNSGQFDELIEFCDDYFEFANPSFIHNSTKWSDGNNYQTITENCKAWLTKRAEYIYSHLTPYDIREDIIDPVEEEFGQPDRIDMATLEQSARLVDVYTLQGIKVRSQVSALRYAQGLMPGIYIVDGRKVVVRP